MLYVLSRYRLTGQYQAIYLVQLLHKTGLRSLGPLRYDPSVMIVHAVAPIVSRQPLANSVAEGTSSQIPDLALIIN